MQVQKSADLSEDNRRSKLNQENKEKKCFQSVITVADLYANKLRNDISSGISIEELKEKKSSEQNEHKIMYCKNSSGHLAQFYNFTEQMLAETTEEANKRNEENWEMLQNKLTILVSNCVLDEEAFLQEIMADSYIETSALDEYFERTKKSLTDRNLLKLLDRKSKQMEVVVDEFETLMTKEVKDFQKRVEEKNKNNERRRNVRTAELPKSSRWFQKLWESIKSLIGLHRK